MALDDHIRDRVIFLGGRVAGVDCPNCQFSSRDIAFSSPSRPPVTCPDCGTTILTEEQYMQLRQTGKL